MAFATPTTLRAHRNDHNGYRFPLTEQELRRAFFSLQESPLPCSGQWRTNSPRCPRLRVSLLDGVETTRPRSCEIGRHDPTTRQPPTRSGRVSGRIGGERLRAYASCLCQAETLTSCRSRCRLGLPGD